MNEEGNLPGRAVLAGGGMTALSSSDVILLPRKDDSSNSRIYIITKSLYPSCFYGFDTELLGCSQHPGWLLPI